MSDEKKTGEKRYGRPAGAGAARPAGAKGAGGVRTPNHKGDRPASGERRYGRPTAGAKPAGEHGAPGARPAFNRSAAHPVSGGAASGERRYGRPAAGAKPAGEHGAPGARPVFNRSAAHPVSGGAASGERRYGCPAAGAKPAGEHSAPGARPAFNRSATHPVSGGAASGERRYGRPAAGTKPAGEHGAPGARPAYNRSAAHPISGGAASGKRRYGRPAAGVRRFPRPAVKAEPQETTGLSVNARRLALTILQDVHENNAYAALSLNEHLPKGELKPEDRRLITAIVYGTLENQIKIDYALDKLMDRPTNEAVQRDILRMSAYQILFLDRVPDSAAVNEAVKIVKLMGMESASGFINAVLRNLVRGKDDIQWPDKESDFREWLHIMSSTPLWLTDKLISAYGQEEAEALLMAREQNHAIVVRPNMTKLTDEAFEALLTKKGQAFVKGVAPHAYRLSGVTEPGYDADFQNGMYSIQGQSSMMAAEAVQAKPGMRVLDACAAPGGKSAYLCECMQMTGRVFAWELHESRALLLEGVRRRLKLENLRISVRDASEYREDMLNTLDAVLLDAPCSGTGVMAQKPDIKLRLKAEDIPAIAATQKKLLNTLCRYVKPSGLMVYSTCSILPEENKEQIAAFLQEHPEFTVEPLPASFPAAVRQRQDEFGVQLLGYRDGVEGFYIVRLRRMR